MFTTPERFGQLQKSTVECIRMRNFMKYCVLKACPNGKCHQTMFDGVWSPNISRLDRPLNIRFSIAWPFFTMKIS